MSRERSLLILDLLDGRPTERGRVELVTRGEITTCWWHIPMTFWRVTYL